MKISDSCTEGVSVSLRKLTSCYLCFISVLSYCIVCSLQPRKGLTSWFSCVLCFLVFLSLSYICIDAVKHVRSKDNNIKGRSPNLVKVIFHNIRNYSLRKEFGPSGSKFFALRELPISKRDAVEEKYCLIQ